MHYVWSFFFVLGGVDTHVFEVWRRCHHGATNPRGKLTLRPCGDPDLRSGRPCVNHRLQPFGKPREQRISAGKYDIIVQAVSFVNIAFTDRSVYHIMDAALVESHATQHSGIEHCFGTSDSKDFEVKRIFFLFLTLLSETILFIYVCHKSNAHYSFHTRLVEITWTLIFFWYNFNRSKFTENVMFLMENNISRSFKYIFQFLNKLWLIKKFLRCMKIKL